jgi:hypothetical protein
VTDAPPTTARPDGYDYSGLPETGRSSTAPTASPLIRLVILLATVVVGVALAVVGTLIAATGAHEVAKSELGVADVASLTTTGEPAATVDLLVVEIGRVLEILGVGVIVAAVVVGLWNALRARTLATSAR